MELLKGYILVRCIARRDVSRGQEISRWTRRITVANFIFHGRSTPETPQVYIRVCVENLSAGLAAAVWDIHTHTFMQTPSLHTLPRRDMKNMMCEENTLFCLTISRPREHPRGLTGWLVSYHTHTLGHLLFTLSKKCQHGSCFLHQWTTGANKPTTRRAFIEWE
jgi:hypothetical protein